MWLFMLYKTQTLTNADLSRSLPVLCIKGPFDKGNVGSSGTLQNAAPLRQVIRAVH